MLHAIRIAVETIDSDSLEEFASARSQLANAAMIADDDFTKNRLGPIATAAQNDERENFIAFVESLSETDVWNYDPLPYRRVLSPAESESVWSSLRKAWDVSRGDYWYPLRETSATGLVAFQAKAFRELVPVHALRRILRELKIGRVWQLREWGAEFLEDVDLFDPIYNFDEGTWTSPGYAWVIYASHESSVTIGGTILPHIKRTWPSWQEHQW